jgi:hypothetical protein
MKKITTETKDFKFTLTSIDEDSGTFTGYASVWGVVDAYKDAVQKGAFKKTLKEKKAFPLLWMHDVREPVGVIRGKEDEHGLAIEGELNLDVQRAREGYSLMKQAKAAGIPMGLSIGYQTVIEEVDNETGIRKLKEISLWEISIVTFPACEPARVDAVKSEERGVLTFEKEEVIETLPEPVKATPDDEPGLTHSQLTRALTSTMNFIKSIKE